MALYLVLLAVSLASTSSEIPSLDFTVREQKNATGHWIVTFDARRPITTEKRWEVAVNLCQERESSDSKEIDQLITVTCVFPPLDDTLMPGSIEPFTPTPPPTTPTTFTITTTPPTTTPATSTTTMTTTSTNTPNTCPHSGYQLYPGFNCYKVFPSYDERKTWSEAREQCMRDGGDLMVMESERKRVDVFIPLYNSVDFYSLSWVGVYIPPGGDHWVTVKGEPAVSTWWRPGEQYDNAAWKCATAGSSGLLAIGDCANIQPFICEISLSAPSSSGLLAIGDCANIQPFICEI